MSETMAPKSISVLLVDDNDDTRELYAEYLDHMGYRVEQASDGSQALDRARRLHLPAVIVLDLEMPQMDGIEVARRLKHDQTTRAIPILVLTGYGLRTIAARAHEAGCSAFILKPCLPNELAAAIQSNATRAR